MKSFDEIYKEILEYNKETIELLRKKELKATILKKIKFLLIIILSISSMFFIINWDINIGIWRLLIFYGFTFNSILIMFCIIKLFGHEKNNTYNKEYKQKIVKKFIKCYDENLDFDYNSGINSEIYDDSEHGYYEMYHSEDLIYGQLDDHPIKMSEVHTAVEVETTDSDGQTRKKNRTVFHGLFCVVEVNKLYNGKLKIITDRIKLVSDKDRIVMDSSEFEKYFDVIADDKIQAMQILTSDVINEMINLKKKYKIQYEIIVIKNNIYLFFHTGPVFEANNLKSAVDPDTLKKIYNIINFTFDITKLLINVIEGTEL